MAILEVSNLCHHFREHFWTPKNKILKNLSFRVEEGKVTGFLGANGAGKTTTLKCVLGLLFPEQGKVKFFGQQTLSSEVLKKIGFLPERPFFYEFLSGREFLFFNAQLYGIKEAISEKVETALKSVDLEHAGDKKLRDYSKGMLQRIGIAQAVIHNPKILILDEPMSGLDPDGRYLVYHIIKDIAQKGTSVFFSSHLLHDVESLCQDLVILQKGKCIYNGSTRELSKKVDGSIEITYRDGDKILHLEVSNQERLQKNIDELRVNRKEILQIKNIQSSLEEAYIQLQRGSSSD